jgi:hypothetical protein
MILIHFIKYNMNHHTEPSSVLAMISIRINNTIAIFLILKYNSIHIRIPVPFLRLRRWHSKSPPFSHLGFDVCRPRTSGSPALVLLPCCTEYKTFSEIADFCNTWLHRVQEEYTTFPGIADFCNTWLHRVQEEYTTFSEIADFCNTWLHRVINTRHFPKSL